VWVVSNQNESHALENRRALVGIFLDRGYDSKKIDWLLGARSGFDHHVRDAWHLLIPYERSYAVDSTFDSQLYGVELAANIIDRLEIKFSELPCIVFRASEEEFFYLKLGGMSQEKFIDEIGRIGDLAKECQAQGVEDSKSFRDYVNAAVCIHLRRRKLLSAAKSALPVLRSLLGVAVDIADLT
jgi:hypothetical protein